VHCRSRLPRLRIALAIAAFVVAAYSDDTPATQQTDPAAAADATLSDQATLPTTTTTEAATTTTEAANTPPTDTLPTDFAPIDENTPSFDEPYVPPGPGTVIIHYDLRVNDCFDREEELVSGESRVTTTRLPCEESHRFEVFAELEYPAEHPSIYPGDDIMEDFALQSCYRHFERWVGSVYETSELEISVITPNQIDFEDDLNRYRGIHCAVRRLDGEQLVGTARRSGL
jgi:hypothetical protein